MISIQTKNETKKQTLVKLCSARAPDRVRRENGLDADRVAERHHLEGAPAADDGANAAPLAAERRPVPGLAPPLLPEICQIKSGRDAPRARVTPAQTQTGRRASAPSLRVACGMESRGGGRHARRESEREGECGGGTAGRPRVRLTVREGARTRGRERGDRGGVGGAGLGSQYEPSANEPPCRMTLMPICVRILPALASACVPGTRPHSPARRHAA